MTESRPPSVTREDTGCDAAPGEDVVGLERDANVRAGFLDEIHGRQAHGVPLQVDYEVTNVKPFIGPDDPDYPPQCRDIDGWDQGFIVGDVNDDHGVFRFGRGNGHGRGFAFVSITSTDCGDLRDLTLQKGRAVLTFPDLHDSRLTLLYSGRVTGGEPGSFTVEATGTLGEGTKLLKCATGELKFLGQQNGDGTSSYTAKGSLAMGCGRRR